MERRIKILMITINKATNHKIASDVTMKNTIKDKEQFSFDQLLQIYKSDQTRNSKILMISCFDVFKLTFTV